MFSEMEIEEVITKLRNNKSPGPDRFPGEFYKAFGGDLTPILHRVFNYAPSKEKPPRTWSEVIISVIHKEGKNPTNCSSYTPISLLGNDVKILSKILAKRVQVITELINPDQTGFILGRQGTDNIRRTLYILSMARESEQLSMLLSLDAEKVFDWVDWAYLQGALEKMRLHSDFMQWIRILYTEPKSRVRVNGHLSDFFYLKRGTRQGDPLSPLLFAISIEPLAELLGQRPKISGIVDEGGESHKISLNADNVMLYVSKPIISIPIFWQSLKGFGGICGFKVNESKSEAMMPTGVWPPQLNRVVKLNRSNQGFR